MKFFSVAYIALAVGGREFTTGEGTPTQEDGYGSSRGLVVSTPTVPFTVNALEYSDYSEKADDVKEGNCDTGSTVDAQYTTDAICQASGPCNIGWTEPGEWLKYKFYTTDEQVIRLFERDAILVDITVRIASLRADKFIQLEVYDDYELGPSEQFDAPGRGFQAFEYIVWKNVELDAVQEHSVLVGFPSGKVNLCSVSVDIVENPMSIPTSPFTLNALQYSGYYLDQNESPLGTCNDGLVDAQPTSDFICQLSGPCNIGWTEPGEWISYAFRVLDYDDYDIWLRVASASAGRSIRLELPTVREGTLAAEFDVPANGWQSFEDIVWEDHFLDPGDYVLKVFFSTGLVNFCSITVKDSTLRFFYKVPATINALFYADYLEKTTRHFGNCPTPNLFGSGEGPVDAQLTSDIACRESGDCHIAFTDPGEFLKYQFEIDGRTDARVNITFRVASARTDKTFRAELFNPDMEASFSAPGKGFQIFDDIVWENVYLGSNKYHGLYVHFTTGQVNLCSIHIDYAE
jgi:hypothetical protein